MGSTPIWHSVLNVKALVSPFNQVKAQVRAFSVIVETSLHKPTLLLGVRGPYPVDGLAAQVRVDAGVLGLGGQLGQVAATLAAVLTRQEII